MVSILVVTTGILAAFDITLGSHKEKKKSNCGGKASCGRCKGD
jgi:uncharacterized 2Fe-2S/4Fe-4S cluster protein (DUF4445 family)